MEKEPIEPAIGKERRKRLGQYFTGLGLGRVLASLAEAQSAGSIIDPMVGSGDMLASCLEMGAKPELLAGIELDPATHGDCAQRLPDAHCLRGSAFDPEVISRLPALAWDLVITNPPYVRYQSFSESGTEEPSLPRAMQIRTGLLEALRLFPSLDTEDKHLFGRLISGYSGLSDMAVPAWILCAAMVKPGGRLALVAPESWLSRDYAATVHYLLLRWFDIEFVVEDEHASWFGDAQVKTTLIVARRIRRREAVRLMPEDSTYCHIAISAGAASTDSPIGKLPLQGSDRVEKSFAVMARAWLRDVSIHDSGLVRTHPVPLKLACANVIGSASRQKWFQAIEGSGSDQGTNVHIPREIYAWMSSQGILPRFETFERQGILTGQGLRTGANAFFYADGFRQDGQVQLRFGGPLSGITATAPLGMVKPVLRRQAELPDGFVISPSNTPGWALDLRTHALPEDAGARNAGSDQYETLPPGMETVVRAAAEANFGTTARPVKVWELTAVAPNIRRPARGAPARYWYMLPDFAPRHSPDVLIARVNSATPRAYLNDRRACLIDANFSTMWTQPASKWDAHALLAFMNSTWAQAVIERSGAVMGGGALKLEASHLRRFPVPAFSADQMRQLSEAGHLLSSIQGEDHFTGALGEIDAIVIRALGSDEQGLAGLRAIAVAGRTQRTKHRGRR